jgi:hypothetical protein
MKLSPAELEDYLLLVTRFPLVRLNSDADLLEAGELIIELADKQLQDKLSAGANQYFLVLKDLVSIYQTVLDNRNKLLKGEAISGKRLAEAEHAREKLGLQISEASRILESVEQKMTTLQKARTARMAAEDRLVKQQQAQNPLSSAPEADKPATPKEAVKRVQLVPDNLTLEDVSVTPKKQLES